MKADPIKLLALATKLFFNRLMHIGYVLLLAGLSACSTAAPQTEDSMLASEKNRLNQEARQNPWVFLFPYKAQYRVISDQDPIGEATRKLTKSGDSWELSLTSKLSKWMISAKTREYTQVKIIDQKLYPQKFYTESDVSFKSPRIIEQQFDWNKQLEKGSKGKKKWSLPLTHPIFDRMSQLLQLRADLIANKGSYEYLVSYKGQRETYRYHQVVSEKITSSLGEHETIRFDRIENDDETFSVWLSPELNYFPVKIAQIEKNKPNIELVLQELTYLHD